MEALSLAWQFVFSFIERESGKAETTVKIRMSGSLGVALESLSAKLCIRLVVTAAPITRHAVCNNRGLPVSSQTQLLPSGPFLAHLEAPSPVAVLQFIQLLMRFPLATRFLLSALLAWTCLFVAGLHPPCYPLGFF